jgi:hypothetical protein
MICVASWFDSTDPRDRRRSLELWMSSDTGTRGTLYQTNRAEPGDVWPPAEKIGTGYSRTTAAGIARQLGLVSLTEYPDAPAREPEARPPLGGSEPAPAPTRAELVRERERNLLAEAILYAEAATIPRATSPTMGSMIAAGWRFGLGNVGAETSLGRAADNLHDAGLLVVDWRLGAFRVAPGQLERCRAELEARS